jgi:hypothetical protein
VLSGEVALVANCAICMAVCGHQRTMDGLSVRPGVALETETTGTPTSGWQSPRFNEVAGCGPRGQGPDVNRRGR